MNEKNDIGPTSVRTFGMEPFFSPPTTKFGPAVIEPYIDKIEVARRLGKTTRCVDIWMKRGWIPFFKIGRTVTFKWADVEAHLTANYRVCQRAVSRRNFPKR